MHRKNPPGLFITGTGTGVGKTYVATRIVSELRAAGWQVGVYKPVASGCFRRASQAELAGKAGPGRRAGPGSGPEQDQQSPAGPSRPTVTSPGRQSLDDDELLWRAAGQPGELSRVCPQRFTAPLAPHLAARAEGRTVDPQLLRTGLEYWRERSEIVVVEGAGGLMSPVTDEEYVADLALDFGYPLIVVAPNVLGVINQTLQTLITAATFREGLFVAGVVLNDVSSPATPADPSRSLNRPELESRCVAPLLAQLAWNAHAFDRSVDWKTTSASFLES